MCYENDIEEIIGIIKNCGKLTDLYLVYNMNRKVFIINDRVEERLIKSFFEFDLSKFKDFLSEFDKLSIWDSDYEIEFKITKNY